MQIWIGQLPRRSTRSLSDPLASSDMNRMFFDYFNQIEGRLNMIDSQIRLVRHDLQTLRQYFHR